MPKANRVRNEQGEYQPDPGSDPNIEVPSDLDLSQFGATPQEKVYLRYVSRLLYDPTTPGQAKAAILKEVRHMLASGGGLAGTAADAAEALEQMG